MTNAGDKIFAEDQALVFATLAHGDQRRKYTNDPYMRHPCRVAGLVRIYLGNDSEVLAAALLHDVIEDTSVTLAQLELFFSDRVVRLVQQLTDVSRPEDGNRAVRKELDRQHIAKASPEAKSIKLADLIDNAFSIVEFDPSFAKVFMKEKRALLEVLTEGDARLLSWAKAIVDDYFDGPELGDRTELWDFVREAEDGFYDAY